MDNEKAAPVLAEEELGEELADLGDSHSAPIWFGSL